MVLEYNDKKALSKMGKTLDMQMLGEYVLASIKTSGYVPVDRGILRDSGIRGYLMTKDNVAIKIGVGEASKYVAFLQEGTMPHDIPNAFGLGEIKPNPYTGEFPFGVGGKFNGKFHPGQKKHVGFVDKLFGVAIDATINFIGKKNIK